MRPGRLDRILYVGPPDHSGRVDILKIQTSKMAVDPDLNLEELASMVRTHDIFIVTFVLSFVRQTDALGQR